MEELHTLYQKALSFAAEKHADQKMPGSKSSYLVHLSNVAMEILVANFGREDFDLPMAVQVALLHDVLEDTTATFEELKQNFGDQIADAVLALTKNEALDPDKQIPDSLLRIKSQPREIWAVKLADRISNMQKPPLYWDKEKKKSYQKVAKEILDQLKGGHKFLEQRLALKIKEYDRYLL